MSPTVVSQDCVLAGLTVTELAADPCGELLGKWLAALGAAVTKIEPPSGSPSRTVGPFLAGHTDPDHSLNFWYYNTNKRSKVIDVGQDGGYEQLADIFRSSDVLILSMPVKDLRASLLDPRRIHDEFESLVIVSLTPFGLTGPRSDWQSCDLVSLALGSTLNSCGYDDHSIPPIRPGGNQSYHTATSFGLIGAMLALLERQTTGRGQLLDIAIHDCLAVSVEFANPYWFYPKVLVQRQTCRHAQPAPTQPQIFRCGDGRWIYLLIFVVDGKGWNSLLGWLKSRDLALDLADPSYSDPAYRQAHFHHIQETVEAFLLLQTAEEAYREGQARGLAIGPVNAPDELFDDEHLRARQFFVEVEHEEIPSALYPGVPFRFSEFETCAIQRAPTLGDDGAFEGNGTLQDNKAETGT